MQNVFSSFTKATGNTSLIYLKGPSAATGCHIYGKAEYQNPGGSVKDRAATWMVLDAEERGVLSPGKPGIIVEGTAGNTGIGLALVGNERGYRTIICIANTQSQEKKDTLRCVRSNPSPSWRSAVVMKLSWRCLCLQVDGR